MTAYWVKQVLIFVQPTCSVCRGNNSRRGHFRVWRWIVIHRRCSETKQCLQRNWYEWWQASLSRWGELFLCSSSYRVAEILWFSLFLKQCHHWLNGVANNLIGYSWVFIMFLFSDFSVHFTLFQNHWWYLLDICQKHLSDSVQTLFPGGKHFLLNFHLKIIYLLFINCWRQPHKCSISSSLYALEVYVLTSNIHCFSRA